MRNCTLRQAALLLGLSVALATNSTRAVDFTEIARFDVGSASTDPENPEPQDIGSNPIAVAWNGTKLYIAGYNGTGDTLNNLDLGIVEITNPTATGIVDTPSFGTAFGKISSGTFRAFSGLDLSADGSSLAATHDNGEFGNDKGIQVFNTSDNSERWVFDARTITGPAFDPGWSGDGSGSGVATARNSSGRRHLYDTTTGAELFGPSGGVSTPGFIWTSGMGGFLPRDMDFDPDTGDIYVRHNNRLTMATRTGGNEASSQMILVDPYGNPADNTGNNFLAQNLSFLSNTIDGDLIIYNDKDSNTNDQTFADTVKVVDPTGAAQTANFALLNGDSFPLGGASYDFDFDPVSQTLALLDFSNRSVHIFQVGAVVAGNADFNGIDGVNGADFLIWQRGFGVGNSLAQGDANGSGGVDGADLAVWKSQFGNGGTVGVAVAAVPEPTAAVALLVGLCLLGTRRLRD